MSAMAQLTSEDLRVWRSFLRAHATITRTLEAELVAEQDLSLAAYDVLVQLVEAPARRLRMADLADRVLLSRSGVTRLIDRMQRDGLVERQPVDDDARGRFTALTPAGYDRLRRAAGTHLRGVGRHVIDRLSPDELASLGTIMNHLLETQRQPAAPPDLTVA